MDGINKKYGIVLETLTPLAIGAGAEKDWMLGMDYVVKDGYLYKLNLQKIAQEGINLSRLTSYFEQKNSDRVQQLLGNKLGNVSDFKMKMPIESANDIKAFVKNQLTGKPIVPGSSVKGAIRSILLEYFTNDERIRKTMRGDNKMDESDILGKPEDGSTFMRFVKLTDFEFEQTELVNTKIFNLFKDGNNWQGGWKHGNCKDAVNTTGIFKSQGFNTIYEVVGPKKQGNGCLMLSEQAFNKLTKIQNYAEKKKNIFVTEDNVPVMLFKLINDHTKCYLEKELEFFKKYPTDKTSFIKDGIERLLKEVENAQEDNSYCIFKMSAGSGFHSITGDWLFNDYTIDGVRQAQRGPSRGLHNGKESSKSRKIAIYDNEHTFSLMGFVKMSIMNAEQIAALEQARQERISQREKECEARKQAAEEAKKQEEKQRRQEEELQKLHAAYEAAIKKAEYSYERTNQADIESLKSCLILFEAAACIFPSGGSHNDRIAQINSFLQLAEIKAKNEADAAAKRKIDIVAGLSILEGINLKGEYNVKNFKNVQDRVNSWMKKAKYSSLPEDQDEYLLMTLSRIFKVGITKKEIPEWTEFDSKMWKTIVGWCGLDRAKKIFDSIMQ